MQKIYDLNTDSVQLFLQFIHNSGIARNTIESLTIQPMIVNGANAHFHENGNMLHQNKQQQTTFTHDDESRKHHWTGHVLQHDKLLCILRGLGLLGLALYLVD